MPYLLSAFFFILGLNLIGQIPFFPGSANVTGNISITIVLAVLTFLICCLAPISISGSISFGCQVFQRWMKIFILDPN